MDHLDVTTGVLDSWDLLEYPYNTCIDQNKPRVLANKLRQYPSSTSLLLKKTSYSQEYNRISAGYYPVSYDYDTNKNFYSAYEKPLIHITVIPRSPQATTTPNYAHRTRKRQTKKNTLPTLDPTINLKKIYILLSETKKDKINTLNGTNAQVFKEVSDNSLLSECVIERSYEDMNFIKKKTNGQGKEKEEQARPVPECSPGCAYLNFRNKTKNISDGSGSLSPPLPCRTAYKKTITQVESDKSTSSEYKRTERRLVRSPDKLSLSERNNSLESRQFEGRQARSPDSISLKELNKYSESRQLEGRQVRSPDKLSLKDLNKSSESKRTEGRQVRSPDRLSLKENARAKSSYRSSRQTAKVNGYQTAKSNRNEETNRSPSSYSDRSIESILAELKRKPLEEKKTDDKNCKSSRPGRIRITGRVGLTDDDECVLACNATLNDKPIATHFKGADCALLPQCFKSCTDECSRKESQSTQVDFQLMYSPARIKKKDCGYGKVIQQSACVNTVDKVEKVPVNKEERTKKIREVEIKKKIKEEEICVTPKNQQNPIIVISVYSKNGASSSDNSSAKNQNDTKRINQKKDVKKVGRSRSPSPSKSIKKGSKNSGNVSASSSKKTVSEKARKSTKAKVAKSQSKSIVKSTVTKSKVVTESKVNKSKSSKSQKSPPQSRRSTSPRKDSEQTNPEQMKRALIDDFTKNYTSQMVQRNAQLEIPLQTKHNVSNITIDIAGNSEYYNVKLEQDVAKLNTELTVRNPYTCARAAEMTAGETDSRSLENFLFMPENKSRKRSFSQTLMYDGTGLTDSDKDVTTENEDENDLNVKDSIEVSHRREHRTSSEANHEARQANDEYLKEVDTGPVKHFNGDRCSISDPNKRDREIRRLLGIDKGIRHTIRLRSSVTSSLFGKSSQDSLLVICDTTLTRTSMNTPNSLDKNVPPDALYTAVNSVDINRSLYHMIWNPNIQLLYQLRWRKQKPIVLTRYQYIKLKRSMYNTVVQKQSNILRTKWSNHYHNIVTAETKKNTLHYDRGSQTEDIAMSRSDFHIMSKITECGDISSINGKAKDSSYETFERLSNAILMEHAVNIDKYMHNVERTVFISTEHDKPNDYLKDKFKKKYNSLSEIQYKNKKLAITKHKVKVSASDIIDYQSRHRNVDDDHIDSCSVQTIFKCHHKSVTPNLGTSDISFCDPSIELDSRPKFEEDSINTKPKKPFLRRLISCLVFRVKPVIGNDPGEAGKATASLNSSFDSYYISSPHEAIEMGSSLYDTSASFYSDHTIIPVKMKRGFFSSIRGFLSRKS